MVKPLLLAMYVHFQSAGRAMSMSARKGLSPVPNAKQDIRDIKVGKKKALKSVFKSRFCRHNFLIIQLGFRPKIPVPLCTLLLSFSF